MNTEDNLDVNELKKLTRKLSSGKTLTTKEAERYEVLRQKLQEKQSGFVTSLEELASRLGISKRQVIRWTKLDGSPKKVEGQGYNVEEWFSFVKSRGLSAKKVETTYDIIELKAKKLLTEIETQKLKLEIAKNRFISREVVESEWARRAGELKNKLYLKFTMEIPPILIGKTIYEIQQLLQKELDNILSDL